VSFCQARQEVLRDQLHPLTGYRHGEGQVQFESSHHRELLTTSEPEVIFL
jgi:hypothetical protein